MNRRLKRSAWAALLLVALALRAYRLTGWLLTYDEGHWLLYVLRPELLWQTEGSSYARPDRLFAWLGSVSVRFFGPNELALRLWPVLFGTLSIFPLGWFVSKWTGDKVAGLWAGALLAVSPLHVYLSAVAIPDVVAMFFVFCALVGFAHLVGNPGHPITFAAVSVGMALAILTKASALYLWLFLVLAGSVFLRGRSVRWAWYGSLLLALVPFGVIVGLIKWQGGALTFFEQPTVRQGFGLDTGRIAKQIGLFVGLFGIVLVPMAVGVSVAWKRDRKWLVWLAPLGLLVITPTFRAEARELLYTLPAVGFFSGLAAEMFRDNRVRGVVLGCLIAVSMIFVLFGVPGPALGPSVSERTVAVLARPTGWPSRDAARWLKAHVDQDEAILITGLGFTDRVAIDLREAGVTLYAAATNWERLRDPANRIKFAVFVDDPQLTAPQLLRYAEARFTKPPDAEFPGYTIYDCQREGRFATYPDALNSAAVYVQRGIALLQQGQCAGAIDAFQTALLADAASRATKRNLMTAYLECGRSNDAVQVGLELLQLEPADPVVNVNMAILYLRMGKIDEGLAQCRHNIQFNIAPAVSYGVMGQLFETRNDFPSALDAYEKSLSLDPTNPVTVQLLSQLKAKLVENARTP